MDKQMNKARVAKNISVLCAGFLLQFCAYQGLANLQSTMNSEEGIGVISQSVIYAALILSSLLLPKMIISKLGCKWTLVISMLTYCPYVAANFWPTFGTFLPTAFLVGMGAAPLWSAKCVYLNEIAHQFASVTKQDGELIVSRFFGIFFMVFGTTQIWGNLISYYVLKPSNATSHESINSSLSRCGIDFCSLETAEEDNPNLDRPSDQKRYMLTAIYLASIILASVIVAIGLDPLKKENVKNEPNQSSWLSNAGATFNHMKKVDQLLLIPLTIYSGIEQAFFLGEFTMAYIACSWGIYHVGYVFICYGVVDALMAYVTGRLLKYFPRSAIISAGCVGNLAACIGMFTWTPTASEYPIFFVFAAVWGFSDAVWQTHINAFYGHLFQGEEEAAFSNYRLWESAGFLLAFAVSKYLCTSAKLSLLLSCLLIGMGGYVMIELKIRFGKARRSFKVDNSVTK